jgi:hypothetical protein
MRVLENQNLQKQQGKSAHIRFQTSGDPNELSVLLPTLLGMPTSVEKVSWMENRLCQSE